jgi:hypothetical protein
MVRNKAPDPFSSMMQQQGVPSSRLRQISHFVRSCANLGKPIRLDFSRRIGNSAGAQCDLRVY